MSTNQLQVNRYLSLYNGKLSCVLLSGSTHGNELCGKYVAKYFKEHHDNNQDNFKLQTMFTTNEKAVEFNRRFFEEDLNRQFWLKILTAPPSEDDCYETRRARTLNELYGPKWSENPQVDFHIDLHNTTSNTGVMCCYHPKDVFAREVVAYLKSVDPTIKANLWKPDENGDIPFFPSISRSGLTLEVGPVAHSTVSARIFEQMVRVVKMIFYYINKRNERMQAGTATRHAVKVSEGSRFTQIDYPRQNGDLTAVVHERWQGVEELGAGKECKLTPGDPLFYTFDGSVIPFDPTKKEHGGPFTKEQLEKGLYPVFINEAAYYEQGIAMMITEKVENSCEVVDVEPMP